MPRADVEALRVVLDGSLQEQPLPDGRGSRFILSWDPSLGAHQHPCQLQLTFVLKDTQPIPELVYQLQREASDALRSALAELQQTPVLNRSARDNARARWIERRIRRVTRNLGQQHGVHVVDDEVSSPEANGGSTGEEETIEGVVRGRRSSP